VCHQRDEDVGPLVRLTSNLQYGGQASGFGGLKSAICGQGLLKDTVILKGQNPLCSRQTYGGASKGLFFVVEISIIHSHMK
jgi:hypothetical protein